MLSNRFQGMFMKVAYESEYCMLTRKLSSLFLWNVLTSDAEIYKNNIIW